MSTQAADPTQPTPIEKLKEIRNKVSRPRPGPLASIRRFFGQPAFPVDSYWYRAQFVIAANAANDALKEDPTGSDPRSKDAWRGAREKAECLVTGVERALSNGVGGSLRSFLEELEPTALSLLAGTFIGDDSEKLEISGDLQDERDRVLEMAQSKQVNSYFLIAMATSLPLSPRAHYNLACYYSSEAAGLELRPVPRGERRSKQEERTTTIATYYSKSFDELELALSGLDAGWKHAADHDASLRGVKEHQETRDKFRRLVSAKSE